MSAYGAVDWTLHSIDVTTQPCHEKVKLSMKFAVETRLHNTAESYAFFGQNTHKT